MVKNINKKIKLDNLKLELIEINKLLYYLKTSYNNIKHRCTQCNSFLTAKQSAQRMKIDLNILEVQKFQTKLQKRILISMLKDDELPKQMNQNGDKEEVDD